MISHVRVSLDAMVRLTWLLTAAVFLGMGVGLVWWPSAQHIASVRDHARAMYESANRNDAIVARSEALERIRGRVASDVRRLGGRPSLGAVTARTLALVNDEARRFHVTVQRIAPDTSAVATTDAKDVLEPLEFEIGLRGRFADLLALIGDVPRHDVLIEITHVDLKANPTDSSRKPVLDATLHATLYRVRASSRSEK